MKKIHQVFTIAVVLLIVPSHLVYADSENIVGIVLGDITDNPTPILADMTPTPNFLQDPTQQRSNIVKFYCSCKDIWIITEFFRAYTSNDIINSVTFEQITLDKSIEKRENQWTNQVWYNIEYEPVSLYGQAFYDVTVLSIELVGPLQFKYVERYISNASYPQISGVKHRLELAAGIVLQFKKMEIGEYYGIRAHFTYPRPENYTPPVFYSHFGWDFERNAPFPNNQLTSVNNFMIHQ